MAFAAIVAAGCLANAAAQTPKLPAGFVYLRDIDPTIIQDIRYAGVNNFMAQGAELSTAGITHVVADGLTISLSVLAGLPMVLLALWVAIRRTRISFADYLGLRGTSWKNVIIGVVALVVLVGVWDMRKRHAHHDPAASRRLLPGMSRALHERSRSSENCAAESRNLSARVCDPDYIRHALIVENIVGNRGALAPPRWTLPAGLPDLFCSTAFLYFHWRPSC